MAKAPCARLTNPISPIVTESPTETMNSTVPADRPPNRMLMKLPAKSTGNPLPPGGANGGRRAANSGDILFANRGFAIRRHGSRRRGPTRQQTANARRSLLRRARAERKLLALVLHLIDLSDHLLVELAVGALHDLVQIFVHDDVAGRRIDHDRTLRAVE